MTQQDPVQAQLTAMRRQQILAAAIQVFSEKGFHSATIRDVAKTAGLADGTIYNYFENKTALLIGILDLINETPQRESDLAESENADVESWTRDYIQHRLDVLGPQGMQVMRALLPELISNRELSALYMEKIAVPTYKIADAHLQKMADQGKVDLPDAALYNRAISGMVLGLMLLYLMGEPTVTDRWTEIPGAVTKLVFDGIRGGNDAGDEGKHRKP